ncbi:predicted protein [Streptomyces sp. SPB78]|uniref:hypothetical protein n=1 Tax=Streptomyces sp. (strain SPB78) TaxID=591157 RepID=UPI0001B54A18|nr:hypothetical protein [Streptomyces sp. SPB78]EFL04294.1 predicted protein [Streptomyces sp. SPB78]
MTDHNAYRWQAAAHAALGDLIRQGAAAGLPPLTWTLAATTGALTGEVPWLSEEERGAQHAAMTAWAALLGATLTERVRTDGTIVMHAFIAHSGDRVGALRAEIYPEDYPDDSRPAQQI